MSTSFSTIPFSTLPSASPITINSLITALQLRLGVPTNKYWSTAELTLYVKEALRCWNAYSRYWKVRTNITVSPGQLFYDLSQTAPASNYLAYTIQNTELIQTIQYHFIENPNPIAWLGTEMFTMQDFLDAIQRRRDQFLLETGAVISPYTLYTSSSPVGRFVMSEAVIDVRRVVLQDINSGQYNQLSREDEDSLQSFLPRWQNAAGLPIAYSVSVTPPFQIQLAPPPQTNWALQLMVVSTGPPYALDVGDVAATPLGVPDDWAWVVKWGAMADLLRKDSPARDPARAEYCETRYQQGADLARTASTVIGAQINNTPVGINSLYDLDYFDPNWHNIVAKPKQIAMAGQNMLAISRIPQVIYGVSLDIVQSAPVSSLTADLLLSPATQDVILDYAEHLAAFKMGGAEFMATVPLFERFERMSGISAERFLANAPFAKKLVSKETKESTERWERKALS